MGDDHRGQHRPKRDETPQVAEPWAPPGPNHDGEPCGERHDLGEVQLAEASVGGALGD